MPGRGGFFSRAVRAVRRAFTREAPSRPAPSTRPPAPRTGRDRQRARERDPYLRDWDTRARGRVGYLEHRALIDDLALQHNLDADEKREIWDDYLRYLVGRKGVRPDYRRNDLHNPFWTKWGVDPDSFDWYEWREAMGYSHGNRK